jgi:hypothetical protein
MLEVECENPEKKFIEVTISGRVTRDAIKELYDEIESRGQQWGKVNILQHFKEMTGADIMAVWDDLRLYLKNRHRFHKLAFVSHKDWMKALVLGFGPMFGIKVKVFDENELEHARQWLAVV